LAMISIAVISTAVLVSAIGALLFHDSDTPLTFFVLGDSQGYQGGIEVVAETADEEKPAFVFHTGDLTPFGQENQYQAVEDALADLQVTFHATEGNHDIRLGGGFRFVERFGSANYSFDVNGAHCAVINTSSGDMSESEIRWFERDLSESQAEWKFVFTHMPLFNPVSGIDHTLSNLTTAGRLIEIAEQTGVDAVFAGHLHLFNLTEKNGVKYAVSGGAGTSLYGNETSGGIFHYLNVTLDGNELSIEPVLLPAPSFERDSFVLRGSGEDVVLTVRDLQVMNQVEGFSSFQNQLGNWRGQGTYRGVAFSDILEIIGGLGEDSNLIVRASDGVEQAFSYSNVYPNETWTELQGPMVLAYSYNGTLVPAWEDGLRLVMMPEDGMYSNEDCEATSEPGQGYNVYASAGARWLRWVAVIEVVAAT